MGAKISTFEKDGNSYPTIALFTPGKDGKDSKFAFTFGVSKAKLIMENYDAIKQFVADNNQEA